MTTIRFRMVGIFKMIILPPRLVSHPSTVHVPQGSPLCESSQSRPAALRPRAHGINETSPLTTSGRLSVRVRPNMITTFVINSFTYVLSCGQALAYRNLSSAMHFSATVAFVRLLHTAVDQMLRKSKG
ncbi:hypothetical protein F2P81_004222 [Scophthalmus maximus]|uniref:Uncharacterized protein n=1 Tax=Scophthalmus maximus TaxID=52904 RepID=A0A6A4TCA4_SCOMX|nr:hypothetical protein F2P81_004222 [Scophthalmus maximus]